MSGTTLLKPLNSSKRDWRSPIRKMACCLSFLLWLALLQTSLAVNVPGPNGTVVTQILSATSSNSEVKVVEDRDLGKILVYPPQPKEFTVKIIARIMYPDDQYLEKISTVMVGATGVTIESDEIRNSLILATLKVAPGASGGRFSITYENEDNPNHKGCNVRLLPVEVKVNDTVKEEDDLVPVSKGTDEDLATDFSVKVSGMGGLTADLKVKGTDGGIKFKDQTLTLTDGVEAKTKLWGTSPSSDKDKTTIEITLKKGSEELGKVEEEVTVFEGVEIEFEGTFYSPVDTRDFQRRLSDGVTPYGAGHQFPGVPPVIPASYVNNPNFNAALQQDTQDYSSSLVFQVGDQGVQRRVWSNPNPSIEIKNIWTKDPRINLDCDPLENGIIACNKGRFFQTGGLPDLIVDPQFEFKSGVKSYFKVLVQNRNDDKRIFNITRGQAIGTAVIKAQIDAAVQANTGDKLAEWGRIRFGGADNTNYAQILNSLSNLTSEWENDSFEGVKKADFKDSIAAKGIMAWQEVKGLKSIRNYFKLKKFNEWTLSGELEKGKLETITP